MVNLLFRTGHRRADSALETIVGTFETAFPEGQRRYVLLGSYAKGTPHDSSDLDVVLIFERELSVNDKQRVIDLSSQLAREIEIDADIAVCRVSDCPPPLAVCLAKGRTVYGNASVAPLRPLLDDYTASLREDVRSLMQGLRPGQTLKAPLTPPNPALPLLGYEAKPLRGQDGVWRPSTKALSMITFWGASAVLAHRTRTFTSSKDEVIDLYSQSVGDEWLNLLIEVDRICRDEYRYAIPDDDIGRAKVRALADRVLAFENHLYSALSL